MTTIQSLSLDADYLRTECGTQILMQAYCHAEAAWALAIHDHKDLVSQYRG